MIAYWPKGISRRERGSLNTEHGHVIDIMATCLDLAKATYPETYKGHTIIPLEGKSLVPIFKKGERVGHPYLGFEHFYERALIADDGWKIVRPGNKADWELYNISVDRSEQHNLADQYPEKLQEMVKAYEEWAHRCMVEPYPVKK